MQRSLHPWRLVCRAYELCLLIIRANKLVNETTSREPPERPSATVLDLRKRLSRDPPRAPLPHEPPPPPRSFQPAVLAALLALVIVISTGATVYFYSHRAKALTTDETYQTAANEVSTRWLDDRTVASMGKASKIRARYTQTHRIVEVIAGDVSFDVAFDAARPFIVSTRAVELENGTKFRVTVDNGVAVTVNEGSVTVRRRGAEPGTEIEVPAGKTYRQLTDAVANALLNWRLLATDERET